MTDRLSHTAEPSVLTGAWHKVRPFVPSTLRYSIRKNMQYVHSRKLCENDALLLSYPKSGSTWLRSMLLQGMAGDQISAAELAKWIPPLHRVSDPKRTVPRVVRSHDSFCTPGFGRSGKILVLVRDPSCLLYTSPSPRD